MASLNGTNNSHPAPPLRKGPTTGRRNMNRVVPAIPLPYIQKRVHPQRPAVVEGPPPAGTPLPSVSGSGDAQATPKGTPLQPSNSEPQERTALEGVGNLDPSPQQLPDGDPSSKHAETAETVQSAGGSTEARSPALDAESPKNTATVSSTPSVSETTTDSHISEPPRSMDPKKASREPKYGSSRPEMINALRRDSPGFQPSANSAYDHVAHPSHSNDAHPGPMMNPRPTHQPHPSTNSITFTPQHSSNNSSPAPMSAGYGPPPGFSAPNGGSYMGRPSGPEFRPQSFAYGSTIDPTTTMDPYGQAMSAYATHEGPYPPFVSNYMPTTPHSFPGSQPSPQPEDGSMYGIPSGGHVHFDEALSHPHGSMYAMGPPPGMMHTMPPPHMLSQGFEPDGEQLLEQVKRNFQDTRFSDCILELYFPDQRAPPLRFPAHRLILAQSRTLEQLMLDSSLGGRRKGSSGPGVRVRADDKYLRSDAFMVAVQRLYGFALFEIPLPPPGTDDLPMAGGVVEQFKFVISYAAAGHLLQYRSVVVRGMEMAARLIGWDTIELALAFSLGSTAARGTIDFHEKWHYGGATSILYEAIVAFVASQLTSNFEFDFAAEDPEDYRRLPKVDTPKPRPHVKSPSPAIARGSVVQLTPKHRSRLSKIKFGDITLEESKKATGGDNRGIPQHTPNQLRTLSKILLNLPFDSVKSILESSRFGLDMDDISVREERRLSLITDVLSERETRRLAVLDAVKDGRLANSDAVRRMLSSVEPRTTDECSVLGFREIVAPVSNGIPYISRAWIPVANPHNGKLHGSAPHFTMAYP